MNVKTKGYTLACISAVTYGTIPLFALPIKHAGYSFDTALFYRFLFSAILIGVYLFAKKSAMRVSGKDDCPTTATTMRAIRRAERPRSAGAALSTTGAI